MSSLIEDCWLTTAQAAKYTGRHPGTVLRAAAAGNAVLQSEAGGRGRGRRYRKEWLDAWVKRTGHRLGRTRASA